MPVSDPSPEFVQVWNLLGIAYPNYCREQNAATLAQTLRLYWQLLADLPIEQIKCAALRHIAANRFFPSVAELREAATALAQLPRQSAVEAWGEVLSAFADSRYYCFEDHVNVPQFDNPITNRLIQSMGWRELCASDNVIADRARFIQSYEQLAARERSEASIPVTLQAGAQAPQLSGDNGHAPQLPSRSIGDVTAAITRARRMQ